MSLVVGLDIGTRSLTGAVVAGTSGKFRLIDFFKEEIPVLGAEPQGPSGEFVPPVGVEELLQKALADRNLLGADIILAMESKDCVLRQIQVPFTKEEQIRRVVSFAAEEYFPSFNLDEVVLEYLKVGESNGKSQLMVAALRNEVIAGRLALARKAGVDPVALDLDCAALFNAFALTPLHDPEKPTLLLDMGATTTKIVLVEGDEIKKIRSFRTASALATADRMLAQPAGVGVGAREGSGSLNGAAGAEDAFRGYSIEERFQEIENALRRLDEPGAESRLEGDRGIDEPIAILSDEEFAQVRGLAEEIRAPEPPPSGRPGGRSTPAANGGGDAGAEGVRYGDYLDRVAAEIHRTFAVSAPSIGLICLTGGLSDGEEARAFLSREFDVDVVHLDFEGGIPMDLPRDRAGEVHKFGAVAVGLAVKEFGRDKVGIDFRKGKFRYEHRFGRLRFPLLVLSVMVFFFFLQTAYWSYHEYSRLSYTTVGYEEEMRTIHREFFEKDPVSGRTPLDSATSQIKAWTGKGVGSVGKVIDAVDAVRNFAEVMNLTNIRFKVMSMKFAFTVRAKPSGDAKKSVPTGSDSSVELLLEDKDTQRFMAIEQAFKGLKSTVFTAQASSTPTKDGQKVSLTLKLKPSILSQFE